MNKLLIVSAIVLSLIGCSVNKEEKKQPAINQSPLDGELLKFSDSLRIKLADKLTFIESYENLLLFHASRYGIVLTDFSGKKIHDFNPVGGAENEVGYKIKQTCFTKEGNIAIASERGIFIYSQNGQFMNKMAKKFPYNSRERTMHSFVDNNQNHFLTNVLIEPENFSMNMSLEEYYETMHLKMLHNYEDQTSQHILQLPPGSIFKKLDQFYMGLYAYTTTSAENKLLGVVFNPERKLYLYDLNSKLENKGVIKLSPPGYKMPFIQPIENGRADTDLLDKSIKCNSRFLRVISEGNFMYVLYRPGLSVEQSDVSFEEANDSYKKYILKVDIINKKHVGSYELPYEIFHLQGSFNNQLVFSSKTEGYDYETFYLIDAP